LAHINLKNEVVLKAQDFHLLRFLERGGFNFVIPVYQRNYDWSIEQCDQLLHDLEVIIKSNLGSYFLGSIVYISESQSVSLASNNEILIIDGQQRITTISLLLIAIATKLENEKQKKTILDKYILNDLSEGEEKVKLKPIKDDYAAFSAIINDEDYIEESSVTINFRHFLSYLEKSEYKPEEIFEAIGKLKIVDITLEVGIDNPQLIFESLNSTGLDLSASDLIRNFVLMNQDIKTQDSLYNTYWRKIEKNCLYKTDDFIRHFITLKEGYIPNKNKIYKSFKNFRFKNNEQGVESILEELLKFSSYYNQFENCHSDSREIKDALIRLKRLDNSVVYPFLLDMFNLHNDEKLNMDTVIMALSIIESYIVRRFVCDVPTNAMNKIFMTLSKDVRKLGEDWEEKYLDYLQFVLANKKSSGRFPKDEEVAEALLTKNIYNMKAKNKLFLLESLENFQNKEKIDVFTGLESGEISIEHVMPQKLTSDWKKDLGDKFQRIHEQYLHVIGNLSLTGYNSNLQNKPFLEKKKIGFEDSRFWLNDYIKKQNKWTEEEIISRTDLITKRFLSIWQQPEIKEDLSRVFDEEVMLSEDFTFTNRQVKGFQVNDDEFEVDSFRALKLRFLSYLYKQNSNKLFQIQKTEKFGKILIANTPKDMRVGMEIAPGVYTEANASAQSVIKTLRKVLPYYDIDAEDVKVILKNENVA